MFTHSLTSDSLALFLELANDAGNWSGTPLLEVSPAERGNVTDLKVKGLITTMTDDGCVFACFTDAGIALAAEHGISRDDLGVW